MCLGPAGRWLINTIWRAWATSTLCHGGCFSCFFLEMKSQFMELMNQGDLVAHTACHPWTPEGLSCSLVQKQGCFYSGDLNLTQPIKTFLIVVKDT